MNIQLNGSEVLLALTGAARAVPRKNSIPILGCVRFNVENEQVRLTATDLDATAVYTFEESKIINGSGSVIVNIKDLQRLVKKAGRDQVRLCDVKTDQAEITLSGQLGERTYFVPAYAEDEWPEPVADLPVKDADGRFLETLRRVQPFASTDLDRYVLNGVAVQAHQGQYLLAATDGHRLSVSEGLSLPLERDVIVPLHRFLLWPKLDADCAVGADERYFRLVSGSWSVTVKLIEGTFPNYRQVIPRFEQPKAFTIDPQDLPALEEAVRTLPGEQSMLPEKGDVLVFREESGKLVLASTNVETGKHQRTLPQSVAESGVWIALKRGQILDAVHAGFRTWRMEDALTPAHSTTEAGAIHVLMPMRTEEALKKFPALAAPKPAPDTEKSDASDSAAQVNAAVPQTEPHTSETQPQPEKGKVIQMPTPHKETENDEQTNEQPDLLELAQSARDQARDLSRTLNDLVRQVKAENRANKALTNELQNAKGVLTKLKDLAA